MAFVRVYIKRMPQFGKMNFSQQQMLKIGTVGTAEVVNRARAARNADDQSAKPLTQRYAIWKSKIRGRQQRAAGAGAGQISLPVYYRRGNPAVTKVRRAYIGTSVASLRTNRRDLTLTGEMLAGLSVRTVSQNQSRAGWTTTLNRQKAANNDRIERFIGFSPKNVRAVMVATSKVLEEVKAKLITIRTVS